MSIKKIIASVLAFSLGSIFFAAEKGVMLKKDNVLVKFVEYNNAVLFYYCDDDGKKIAVIDDVDYGVSSFIGVTIDNTYYNLLTSGGVKCNVESNDNSFSITYATNKKVNIVVTYSVVQKNILTVQTKVVNLDDVEHIVKIKSVYDTVLGEWNGKYFSTDAKQKIQSEYVITDFAKHKVLTSTDGVTGIRFLLDKDFTSVAFKVVVAAKPYLDTEEIEGRFYEGRGFNTVLSYNNVAVGLFYKPIHLKPQSNVTLANRIEFDQAVLTTMSQRQEDKREAENRNYKYESSSTEIDSSNYPQTASPNSTEQNSVLKTKDGVTIDKDYARDIINRINALKEDGSANKYEIKQLQTELNEIEKQLKSGQ